MDTNKLISGCIKKNSEARKELYEQYKSKLFLVCLKYCRSYMEAEDLLHDVFIEIFEKIKTYKGNGSFEGWMKRIAINKAIDRYKKEINFTSLNEKLSITQDNIYLDNLPTLTFDVLMSYIQKLPSQYRIIFSLFELDNYSHKEIAKMLTISTSSSKSNLHRAKKILKKRISEFIDINNQNITNGR